jgi:hypothetical protein
MRPPITDFRNEWTNSWGPTMTSTAGSLVNLWIVQGRAAIAPFPLPRLWPLSHDDGTYSH